MTHTYDTSVCVACCRLAFSAEVSLTWCVLISRLFLSTMLCSSHLLNSFFLHGKQEVCFHIVLILIKAHLFSSSQESPLKCHLQNQVLGHGLSSSLKGVAASSYFLERNLEKSNASEAQESFLCLPEKIDTT